MKYVIRSTKDGRRIPAAEVEEKKAAARAKLLAAGLHYLEYDARLGYENALGVEVQEEVTIIEAIAGGVYV